MIKYYQFYNYIKKKDKRILKILKDDKRCFYFHLKNKNVNHLFNLSREIIGQQLSVKASSSIWKRFCKGLKTNKDLIHKIKKIKLNEHKNYSLSKNKLLYLKEIVKAYENKSLNFRKLSKYKDEDAITSLCKIKGIGSWTAEMLLLFSFKRINIFSIKDLGLRKAVSKIYEVDINSYDKILKIANNWSPYKSIVSWYLWKALDNKEL